MTKRDTIYDVAEFVGQGTGRFAQMIVVDRRVHGGSHIVTHRLCFDKFDETCLRYIIERNGHSVRRLVNRGRIHHKYSEYPNEFNAKFIVEAEFTHEESGEKVWMPIAYLPVFYYSDSSGYGNWTEEPTAPIYKEFCENSENWEWFSECAPAPIYKEVTGDENKPKTRRKKSR